MSICRFIHCASWEPYPFTQKQVLPIAEYSISFFLLYINKKENGAGHIDTRPPIAVVLTHKQPAVLKKYEQMANDERYGACYMFGLYRTTKHHKKDNAK